MPSDLQEVPPTWTTLSAFDASKDYPRALARLLLALSLTPSSEAEKLESDTPPPLPLPPPPLPSVISSPPSAIEDGRLASAPLPAVMKQSKATLPLQTLQTTSDTPILVPPYRPPAQSGQGLWLVALTVILALILVATISALLVLSSYRAAPTVDTPATLTTSANNNAVSTTIANDNATATADTARLQQIYVQATGGRPILNDPLNSQDDTNWQVATSHNWSCAFTGEAYHLSVFKPNFFHNCLAHNSNFSNFAFQVEMTIIRGNAGGVVFRATSQYGQLYRFLLYQDGSYELYGIRTASGHIPLLIQGNASIHTGQPNVLTVIARDGDIYLYINKIYVAHVRTDMSGGGKLGMECLATTQPAEVVFRNVEVWNI